MDEGCKIRLRKFESILYTLSENIQDLALVTSAAEIVLAFDQVHNESSPLSKFITLQIPSLVFRTHSSPKILEKMVEILHLSLRRPLRSDLEIAVLSTSELLFHYLHNVSEPAILEKGITLLRRVASNPELFTLEASEDAADQILELEEIRMEQNRQTNSNPIPRKSQSMDLIPERYMDLEVRQWLDTLVETTQSDLPEEEKVKEFQSLARKISSHLLLHPISLETTELVLTKALDLFQNRKTLILFNTLVFSQFISKTVRRFETDPRNDVLLIKTLSLFDLNQKHPMPGKTRDHFLQIELGVLLHSGSLLRAISSCSNPSSAASVMAFLSRVRNDTTLPQSLRDKAQEVFNSSQQILEPYFVTLEPKDAQRVLSVTMDAQRRIAILQKLKRENTVEELLSNPKIYQEFFFDHHPSIATAVRGNEMRIHSRAKALRELIELYQHGYFGQGIHNLLSEYSASQFIHRFLDEPWAKPLVEAYLHLLSTALEMNFLHDSEEALKETARVIFHGDHARMLERFKDDSSMQAVLEKLHEQFLRSTQHSSQSSSEKNHAPRAQTKRVTNETQQIENLISYPMEPLPNKDEMRVVYVLNEGRWTSLGSFTRIPRQVIESHSWVMIVNLPANQYGQVSLLGKTLNPKWNEYGHHTGFWVLLQNGEPILLSPESFLTNEGHPRPIAELPSPKTVQKREVFALIQEKWVKIMESGTLNGEVLREFPNILIRNVTTNSRGGITLGGANQSIVGAWKGFEFIENASVEFQNGKAVGVWAGDPYPTDSVHELDPSVPLHTSFKKQNVKSIEEPGVVEEQNVLYVEKEGRWVRNAVLGRHRHGQPLLEHHHVLLRKVHSDQRGGIYVTMPVLQHWKGFENRTDLSVEIKNGKVLGVWAGDPYPTNRIDFKVSLPSPASFSELRLVYAMQNGEWVFLGTTKSGALRDPSPLKLIKNVPVDQKGNLRILGNDIIVRASENPSQNKNAFLVFHGIPIAGWKEDPFPTLIWEEMDLTASRFPQFDQSFRLFLREQNYPEYILHDMTAVSLRDSLLKLKTWKLRDQHLVSDAELLLGALSIDRRSELILTLLDRITSELEFQKQKFGPIADSLREIQLALTEDLVSILERKTSNHPLPMRMNLQVGYPEVHPILKERVLYLTGQTHDLKRNRILGSRPIMRPR